MNKAERRCISILMTILFVVCLGLLIGSASYGQEFTKAQQVIVELEKARWECLKDCNRQAFNTYFHGDFVGYSTCPDRMMARAQKERTLSLQSLDYYVLKPVAVQVQGDVAIVEYEYECGGIPDSICSGRFTNVWKQSAGSWKLITSISR